MRLDAFLKRVSKRFKESHGVSFMRLSSQYKSILAKMKHVFPGQSSAKLYAGMMCRLTIHLSSMQLGRPGANKGESVLLSSRRVQISRASLSARSDAGALFVVKLALVFLDTFLVLHRDEVTGGVETQNRYRTLQICAEALLRGIP